MVICRSAMSSAANRWCYRCRARRTALASDAMGFRSSCANIARNSSLRWSVSRRRSRSSASSTTSVFRSARKSRVSYWRRRVRSAPCNAVWSVTARTGRSRRVTFAREAIERANAQVRTRGLTVGREHDQGKIRPRWLHVQSSKKRARGGWRERLLGDQRRASARRARAAQRLDRGARLGAHPGLGEYRARERVVYAPSA